jgi:hypothetical protein
VSCISKEKSTAIPNQKLYGPPSESGGAAVAKLWRFFSLTRLFNMHIQLCPLLCLQVTLYRLKPRL